MNCEQFDQPNNVYTGNESNFFLAKKTIYILGLGTLILAYNADKP